MVEAVKTISTEEVLGRWQRNTIPIYRFSDPEMSGVSVETQPVQSDRWVKLLPQHLPRLVDEVLLEKGEAEDTFYSYWQRRLTRFYYSRVPEDVEDLAQDATLRIRNALPAFENSGKGTFSQNLHAYCFKIARYTLYGYFRHRRRQPRTSELTGRESRYGEEDSKSDNSERTEGHSVNWDMLWEKVEQLLPERQWQIVDQMRRGYENVVIMKNLGVGATLFRREAHDAKLTIADQLLAPAGLKPINSSEFSKINTDFLKSAAARGKMDAIKILGRWHTTDAAFKIFLWQREHPWRVGNYNTERVSQARVDQVRALVMKGLTIDEIATEIQRHPSLVKLTLAQMRREGEIIKVKRPSREEKRVDYTKFDKEVKVLRLSGMKNADIAFLLEVSIASVTRSIDRLSKKGELPLRKPFGRSISNKKREDPNRELLARIDDFIARHKEPYSIADAMRIVGRAKGARPAAHLRPRIRAILLADGITTTFHPEITQGTLRKICLAVGQPNPKISVARKKYWQDRIEERSSLSEEEREVLRARKRKGIVISPTIEETERVEIIIQDVLQNMEKDVQLELVDAVKAFFLRNPREQYLLSDLFEAVGSTRGRGEDLRRRVISMTAEEGIQRVWKTAPLLLPLRLAIAACLGTARV